MVLSHFLLEMLQPKSLYVKQLFEICSVTTVEPSFSGSLSVPYETTSKTLHLALGSGLTADFVRLNRWMESFKFYAKELTTGIMVSGLNETYMISLKRMTDRMS